MSKATKNESSANPAPLILAALGAIGIMVGIAWFYGGEVNVAASIRQTSRLKNTSQEHPTETINQDAPAPGHGPVVNEQPEDKRGAVRKFLDEINGKGTSTTK